MLETNNKIGFDRFDLKQREIILDDLEGNIDKELGLEVIYTKTKIFLILDTENKE